LTAQQLEQRQTEPEKTAGKHFIYNTNTNPLILYGSLGDLTFNNSDKDEMMYLLFVS
jgi:hypothetical protein